MKQSLFSQFERSFYKSQFSPPAFKVTVKDHPAILKGTHVRHGGVCLAYAHLRAAHRILFGRQNRERSRDGGRGRVWAASLAELPAELPTQKNGFTCPPSPQAIPRVQSKENQLSFLLAWPKHSLAWSRRTCSSQLASYTILAGHMLRELSSKILCPG